MHPKEIAIVNMTDSTSIIRLRAAKTDTGGQASKDQCRAGKRPNVKIVHRMQTDE